MLPNSRYDWEAGKQGGTKLLKWLVGEEGLEPSKS
jgi:hypothetical protein